MGELEAVGFTSCVGSGLTGKASTVDVFNARSYSLLMCGRLMQ